VSEAESQAVLITLTEYDFQDELKKMAEAQRNCAYMQKETTSRVMMDSRPKLNF
jgi:hypothetical protein